MTRARYHPPGPEEEIGSTLAAVCFLAYVGTYLVLRIALPVLVCVAAIYFIYKLAHP